MRPIICDCCQIRIDDSIDRISHGTPNSHIETHVSRTSREQVIEDLREAEELTNDSEA